MQYASVIDAVWRFGFRSNCTVCRNNQLTISTDVYDSEKESNTFCIIIRRAGGKEASGWSPQSYTSRAQICPPCTSVIPQKLAPLTVNGSEVIMVGVFKVRFEP
ncbi:hypothetical protein Ancab_023138 [Ancistrocladus abbreviatus]